MFKKKLEQTSKYRHAVGAPSKRELWYQDLSLGASPSDASNGLAVNQEWIAARWGNTGGTLAILPLHKPGKYPDPTLLHAHGAITDWEFSCFDSLLSSAGEDGGVKIWRPSSTSNEFDLVTEWNAGQRNKTDIVRWHPTVTSIIATAHGKEVRIWDSTKAGEGHLYEMAHENAIHAVSWRGDGSVIGTTCRDGFLRVWDPRQEGSPAMVGSSKHHEGIKSSRVAWIGNTDLVLTTGFSKMREREYALWDVRSLSKPLKKTLMDASTGILMPLVDEDTKIVYLAGRGDTTMRSVEVSATAPHFTENLTGTNSQISGAALVPKQALDVMHVEIARLLVVTPQAIIPVSFQVPRRNYLDFHHELYPWTKGSEPALTAAEWLAGETKEVAKISLDPAERAKKDVATSTTAASAAAPSPLPESHPHSSLEQKTTSLTISGDSPRQITPSGEKVGQLESESTPAPSQIQQRSAAATRLATARTSLYKYLTGKPYHPSQFFDDLRDLDVSKGAECDLIQANPRFIAVALSGSGGRVGIIDVAKPGRLPTRLPAVVCQSSVTDFKFDPFEHDVLLTISDNARINIWKIPENGLEEDVLEPWGSIAVPDKKRVNNLIFNPVAKDIFLTASGDAVQVWDLAKRERLFEIDGLGGGIFSCTWNTDGSKIAVACHDRKLRVIDVVTRSIASQGPLHDSRRPCRIVWLGETEYLASVGFGLGSQREVLVYGEDVSKGPADRKALDVSPGALVPHYDADCRILYLVGRGDSSIHAINIHYDDASQPKLERLPSFESGSLQQGMVLLPKRCCDVRKVELAKLFRLTKNRVEVVGMHVPRQRAEYFQDDLYPPTLDVEHPTLSAEAWSAGEKAERRKIDLRPEDMTPLSQAPQVGLTAGMRKVHSPSEFQTAVTDDQRKQNMLDNLFALSKEDEDERLPQDDMEGVAEDEWDD
ncbi:uncharacterized protein VTP21DRAFT_6234 [Calcarisporiella thermophila]|uniref:uncharacterized protein n=1 Tax=Calcarisporiella thermophila TaxID=911321 RepID=UPI00374240DA